MLQSRSGNAVPVRSFKVSKSWVHEFRGQVVSEDRYAIRYVGGSAIMTPVSRRERRLRSLESLGPGLRGEVEACT